MSIVWGVMIFIAGCAVGYALRGQDMHVDKATSALSESELMKLARTYYEREGAAWAGLAYTHMGCKTYLSVYHRVDSEVADRIAAIALSEHSKSNPLIPPLGR